MEEPRYCEKCGAYIPQSEEKCIACGAGGSSLPTATDSDVLQTTPLGSSVVTIPVDGAAIRAAVLGARRCWEENVLDLDALKGAPTKAKLFGEVGEAYITETTLEPVITCGRDIDGLMRRSAFTMARLTVIWRGAK